MTKEVNRQFVGKVKQMVLNQMRKVKIKGL
jgi:hypothetical protein